MEHFTVRIPARNAWIVPLGDVHTGDRGFRGTPAEDALKRQIEWIAERPNARTFINGDLFNVAGKSTKTCTFSSNPDEYEYAEELLRPIASQIDGAIDGNHENRMKREFGVSPLYNLCRNLRIKYCGWSAVVDYIVGENSATLSPTGASPAGETLTYRFYYHHTTGGSSSVGGGLNRAAKLHEIVERVDVYVAGHNHNHSAAIRSIFDPAAGAGLGQRPIFYTCNGAWLQWNETYAEQNMMAPGVIGAPRVRLLGNRACKSVKVIVGMLDDDF